MVAIVKEYQASCSFGLPRKKIEIFLSRGMILISVFFSSCRFLFLFYLIFKNKSSFNALAVSVNNSALKNA